MNQIEYIIRLENRAKQIINERQVHNLIDELYRMGQTPYQIDSIVFFSLIHEGYKQRMLEEEIYKNANWDYEI